MGQSEGIVMEFDLGSLLSKVDGLDELTLLFDKKEMDDVVEMMPVDHAPGPDGPIETNDEDFPIIQYADDTLLIMPADMDQMMALKENLRSSYQELETKLKEAELKREQAEKQLAEKNSEHIREKGEFILKRNADSETIKRQQKELYGFQKYMETAEHHWDLLNENILEPLGYPEKRRNLFPRDDLLQLAGDDCKDLISASRKICYNLSIKRSRTCNVRKLVRKVDVLPELVTDLQASSARGAAAMTLTMCLAHNPELDLEQVTTGVPPDADVNALLDAVSGYDTRIARRIRHDEFYDKVVLPADEPLEAELQKERDAEARPAESGTQFTWTSSKDAPQEEPKTSAAASEEEEESDEDVSSPAEDAKEKDPEGKTSPAKGE
nr:uncharacterized protein LOC127347513 [Lolium perenne]